MQKESLRKEFASNICDDSISNQIAKNCLDLVAKYNPKIVGIYIPSDHEPEILHIMLKLPGVICAAPKIYEDDLSGGDSMNFVHYYPGEALIQNLKYPKIFEPISDNVIIPDLIFVPGLAFDLKGYRLGRGKGYYDKYFTRFKNKKIIKVGVASGSNILLRLPYEAHDVKMDYLISESLIYSIDSFDKKI